MLSGMCNLYSITKGQDAIRQLFRVGRDLAGNMPALPAVFPNRIAPVIRSAGDGTRELLMMRWGFPAPPGGRSRNPYLTNVRNTNGPYWKPWLARPTQRCLVPVTSFAEPDNRRGDDQPSIWTWFARDENRPLMAFAGIWREWEGDRGTKKAPDVGKHLVFSFLTTDASPDVAPIHPDATPVLLLDEGSWATWLTADWSVARQLQAPPPGGLLKVIRAGEKEKADPA